jgi:hypothetical protein
MTYSGKCRIVKSNKSLAAFFGGLLDLKNSWKSGNKKRQGDLNLAFGLYR